MRRAGMKAAAVLLLAVGLVYVFAMRTGRYQIERLDTTMYAVIDTSTGAHWVYRAETRIDKRGQLRVWFKLEDHTRSNSLLRRFYPERALDDWIE